MCVRREGERERDPKRKPEEEKGGAFQFPNIISGEIFTFDWLRLRRRRLAREGGLGGRKKARKVSFAIKIFLFVFGAGLTWAGLEGKGNGEK